MANFSTNDLINLNYEKRLEYRLRLKEYIHELRLKKASKEEINQYCELLKKVSSRLLYAKNSKYKGEFHLNNKTRLEYNGKRLVDLSREEKKEYWKKKKKESRRKPCIQEHEKEYRDKHKKENPYSNSISRKLFGCKVSEMTKEQYAEYLKTRKQLRKE